MNHTTRYRIAAGVLASLAMFAIGPAAAQQPPPTPQKSPEHAPRTVRVAAVQAQRRLVDWREQDPVKVLAAVEKNLDELEQIVHRAGEQGCDVLAFPEDTLGLLNWYGMNEAIAPQVLPAAVARMIDRLGRAAATHRMYLVVCSDHIEADGGTYNTAFFLGRDGRVIGRYHKTCPTWSECAGRSRGSSLPVFPTPDLGTVGMVICYDLVFPETARCLALAGADILFFPTMGGAAVGDDDIGLQALRVRAAENHVYLVVAFRGGGSMIISPRGKILARAEGADGLAIADIDPRGGRAGGDAMNHQPDMRARLFRERNPAAFGILTDPHPPVLDKVPLEISQQEAGRIAARVLTIGEEEFRDAEALARAGKTDEAIAAFGRLKIEYRGSWIDRVATERIRTLREAKEDDQPDRMCGGEDTPHPHPSPLGGRGARGEECGCSSVAGTLRVPLPETLHLPPPPTTVVGTLRVPLPVTSVSGTLRGPASEMSLDDLPSGSNGLAAKYPGDRGIGEDRAVVFAELFDADSVDRIAKRWESVQDEAGMSLSSDVPRGSGDGRSLLMTHVGGKGTGAHLYRRLEPGYDKLHVRFYVKFDRDCGPIHHFFHVGGYHPSTAWPQGGAGERPRGHERFSTGVEPFGNQWRWDLYSYWMEMRGSPPRGQTWGNSFVHDRAFRVERGRWICAELMMQMNDVGESNGEMALWIDGKLARHLGKGFPRGKWVFDKFLPNDAAGAASLESVRWDDEKKGPEYLRVPAGGVPFEGFRWRSDAKLNVNFLWVLLYITKSPPGHESRVWFDNIVVAREYIGPIAGTP